jgi:hypothetical protein
MRWIATDVIVALHLELTGQDADLQELASAVTLKANPVITRAARVHAVLIRLRIIMVLISCVWVREDTSL